MIRFGWCLVIALVALAACDYGHDEELEVAPLFVRETVPDDSVLVDKDEPLALSIGFNRAVEPGEVAVWNFPPALSRSAEELRLQRRYLSIDRIELDPAHDVHWLLIDGPNMPLPVRVRFFTGDAPGGLIQGSLRSIDDRRAPLREAVIFLLDSDSGFDPTDLRSFQSADIHSCALLTSLPPGTTTTPYALGSLPPGSTYHVVAIVDSSGDGLYEPRDDWWAYWRNSFTGEALVAVAGSPFDGSATTGADMELRRPGR